MSFPRPPHPLSPSSNSRRDTLTNSNTTSKAFKFPYPSTDDKLHWHTSPGDGAMNSIYTDPITHYDYTYLANHINNIRARYNDKGYKIANFSIYTGPPLSYPVYGRPEPNREFPPPVRMVVRDILPGLEMREGDYGPVRPTVVVTAVSESALAIPFFDASNSMEPAAEGGRKSQGEVMASRGDGGEEDTYCRCGRGSGNKRGKKKGGCRSG